MKLATLTAGAVLALATALPAFAADRTFEMAAFADNPAWDEAVKTVTAMVPKGVTVIPGPATGTIHVMNATDATLDEIAKVVKKLNHDASYSYPIELQVFRNGEHERTVAFVIASRKPFLAKSGVNQEYISACNGTPGQVSFQKSTLELGTKLQIEVMPATDRTYIAHYTINHTDLLAMRKAPGTACEIDIPDVDQRMAEQSVHLSPGKAFTGTLGGRSPKDTVTYTLTMNVIPPAGDQ